jgi:hypothetical protein
MPTKKAVNIVQFVRSLEADADIIKAEEKRLSVRCEAVENRAKSIGQYLQYQCMSILLYYLESIPVMKKNDL